VIPISDILNLEPGRPFSPFFFALTIKTKNYDEIYFDFNSIEDRKRCMNTLDSLRQTSTNVHLRRPSIVDQRRKSIVDHMVHEDRHVKSTFSLDELSKIKPLVSLEQSKPLKSMHITCLTIGSRGDVQPYIALCLGLMNEGHTCRIATHLEFQPWIESFGIEFSLVKGDPSDLIQLCVDHDMFSVGFVREAYSKFLGWIDELLIGCSDAGKGTDMLIESPSCFGGIHVAEALGIYYYSAFPMPWTRTRAYPHPFGVPEHHMGGTYNLITHIVIEEALGKALVPMINRWRKDTLGLEPIGYTLDNKKVPFLYSFSSSIVPHPSDWPDWVHICGYWFLDNSEQNWTPPDSLTKFLNDGPPPVYIGFGSIIVPDPGNIH
jgi:sterol 3beta-glucosyltransferase